MDQISWPFLTYSSVTEKTGHCQGYFGSWEHALVAIIVERGLKKSKRMDSLPGQKKVAVVETWLLVKGLTVLQTHLRRGGGA